MPTVLRNLASITPRRLLIAFWVLAVAASLLARVAVLEGVATAILFVLVVGYPYAVILGFGPGVVRSSIRSIARWLLVGLALVLVCMAIFIPFLPEGYSTPTDPKSLM